MAEFLKNFKFNFRYAMALISLAGVYWVLFLLAYREIPEQNRDVFLVLATMLYKDTTGRVMRVLFPDKEDVKGSNKTA